MGFEVCADAVQVVQCGCEPVFCGGDERDVRERSGGLQVIINLVGRFEGNALVRAARQCCAGHGDC